MLNDSRVIPARLRAREPGGVGRFEIMLVEENATNDWWAMLPPGKRGPIGTILEVSGAATATVVEINSEGHRRLRFDGPNILARLDELGETPLPPYIERAAPRPEDRARYQTVFARAPGSVAAPTAGFQFAPETAGEGARTRSRRLPCDAPCRPGHLRPGQGGHAGCACDA